MANTREIVTKAVVGKGKKTFTTTKTVTPECQPTTILGCWVINHTFRGYRSGNKINTEGSYDVISGILVLMIQKQRLFVRQRII